MDNISQNFSNLPLETSHDGFQIDKKYSSPLQSKPDLMKRFDLVYQNDCDVRDSSEKRRMKFELAPNNSSIIKNETVNSVSKPSIMKKPPMRALTMG